MPSVAVASSRCAPTSGSPPTAVALRYEGRDTTWAELDQRTDELAQQRAEGATARPDHLANFIAGIGAPRFFPTEPEVASIRTPTLLIHGRDDRVVHFENSLKLLALIPDSRLVLLNRCGHWAQVEHAAEFNRLVSAFLSSH